MGIMKMWNLSSNGGNFLTEFLLKKLDCPTESRKLKYLLAIKSLIIIFSVYERDVRIDAGRIGD